MQEASKKIGEEKSPPLPISGITTGMGRKRRCVWDGNPPFSQVVWHLNKTSFLLYHHLPHKFGSCGGRQSVFCLVMMTQHSI